MPIPFLDETQTQSAVFTVGTDGSGERQITHPPAGTTDDQPDWSPDGKYIVSGSDDRTVRVWSVDTGQQIRRLDGHTNFVMCVCVTPDGKHIVSRSSDNTVRVWLVDTGQQIRQLNGHANSNERLRPNSDPAHRAG